MSKTRKVEARVLPARLERYQRAREALRLDEMSDFVRRACDELADRVDETLGAHAGSTSAARIVPPAGDLRQVKPDPRKR